MKCPDCKKEVSFHKEYCPHCSAELVYGARKRSEKTDLPLNIKDYSYFTVIQ